jgi:integrase
MKGSLRRQSEHSFRFVVDLPPGADGQRRQKPFTIKKNTKAEAEVEARRILAELDSGIYVDAARILVGAYLERWLTAIRSQVAAKTWARNTEIVRCHLTPSLGSIVLVKLQPLQIQESYETALRTGRRDGRGGLSARTVHHHHRVLYEALDQAVRWQILSRNPAGAVDPPIPVKREMLVLDEDQLVQLFEMLEETPLWMPALLAGTTGARRGEILAVRWPEVRLTATSPVLSVVQTLAQVGDELEFKPPKTKKSRRSIDLLALTVDALRRHRILQAQRRLLLGSMYHDQHLVCPSPDGSPWAPDRLSDNFASFIKRSGLPRVRFHDLRHTHATHLLRAGVHPKIVSERLGHSSVAFTLDIYSHVLPGMQAEAAASVDTVLRAAFDRRNAARI